MQIYKIYINEKLLLLMRSKHVAMHPYPKKSTLVIRYTGNTKTLFQCIDLLEKGTLYERVILHAEDYKKLKADFKALFIIVKAGGGLVMNEFENGLFIFRRGHWDLPKGKCDPGEKRKDAAKREVEEETGVSSLVREKLLLKTRHVFKNSSGQRILKITNWYTMRAPKQKLIPEIREQIEKAVWLNLDKFLETKTPTFNSVHAVVKKYLKKRIVSPKQAVKA